MEMDGESLARQARDREDHLIDRLVFQHFFFLLVEENLMVYLYIYILCQGKGSGMIIKRAARVYLPWRERERRNEFVPVFATTPRDRSGGSFFTEDDCLFVWLRGWFIGGGNETQFKRWPPIMEARAPPPSSRM